MPPFCEIHRKYIPDCLESHGVPVFTWYAEIHTDAALVVEDATQAATMRAAADHFLSKFPGAVEVQIWREDR